MVPVGSEEVGEGDESPSTKEILERYRSAKASPADRRANERLRGELRDRRRDLGQAAPFPSEESESHIHPGEERRAVVAPGTSNGFSGGGPESDPRSTPMSLSPSEIAAIDPSRFTPGSDTW
jgi:hypothetical protein